MRNCGQAIRIVIQVAIVVNLRISRAVELHVGLTWTTSFAGNPVELDDVACVDGGRSGRSSCSTYGVWLIRIYGHRVRTEGGKPIGQCSVAGQNVDETSAVGETRSEYSSSINTIGG